MSTMVTIVFGVLGLIVSIMGVNRVAVSIDSRNTLGFIWGFVMFFIGVIASTPLTSMILH